MSDNEYTYKGHTIKIEHDDLDLNPRTEWDNLGTMVCNHKRYSLGDEEASKEIPWNDFNSWQEAEDYILNNYDVGVILPLYLYDHSGITMNTTGFSCPWDSGRVGFIFITKDKMRKEYSKKRVSKQLTEKVAEYLKKEVETYDQYLTGDVWWYKIEDANGTEIDSCGGYYGYDYVKKECESIVDKACESNAEKFILNKIPESL
jgi:hypothetical protein